jgi:serine/threonine-protein kinase RsbT
MATRTTGDPVIVQVTEEYHISEARQRARSMAEAIGFKPVTTFQIMTSVSELGNNLLFHANHGGTITLAPLMQNNKVGIEIIAEDEGPGIEDVTLALQDGFSTNRGLGGGLPGIKRLMDELEITSTVGTGTLIITRKWKICE